MVVCYVKCKDRIFTLEVGLSFYLSISIINNKKREKNKKQNKNKNAIVKCKCFKCVCEFA